MSATGKHALVTGAGGFIGSHLAEHLLDNEYKVRCFLRYTSKPSWGWLDALPEEKRTQLDIVTGDLRNIDSVKQATDGIDTVFHLGALVSVPYSYDHPCEVLESNTFGTLNVLLAARENGVNRVVYASTSEVYGTAQYVPIDEKHELQAQSPYSASKIGAEKLVQCFHASYDLPVVIIRPFNTYGPRQSARAVIPTIITQVATQSEVHLGEVSTTRDFTYVTDIADAYRKSAETENAIGKVFNIGSNSEIPIADLVYLIADLMGKDAHIVTDDARKRPAMSEVRRLRADNTCAHEALDWQPTVSLQEGLHKTIGWIVSNLDKYRIGKYET